MQRAVTPNTGVLPGKHRIAAAIRVAPPDPLVDYPKVPGRFAAIADKERLRLRVEAAMNGLVMLDILCGGTCYPHPVSSLEKTSCPSDDPPYIVADLCEV